MNLRTHRRTRIMENPEIAVQAVQASQDIEWIGVFAFWCAALAVRARGLAVLAVHPGPFAWTDKADKSPHVLCVRQGVRVSIINIPPGKALRSRSGLLVVHRPVMRRHYSLRIRPVC